jgi:predicted DNA-binding transcriptional regulator AlpA
MQAHPPLNNTLKKDDICERFSLSERTLENMVKANLFPPPVRLGKYVYWSEVAVHKWHTRYFCAQESWEPPTQ